MNDSLQEKAVEATKWSLATQVVSKLISPVTQLVLAHILAPDAFGIIAIITMIVSFADMFSDAGFQKYLIQHDYRSARDLELSADVAFWTNLFVSVAIWASVCFFKDNLASLLGNSSIGFGIAVACSSLPLTALISVQTALYQRRFNFRILFSSKVGSSLLIMFVSIPLAVLGFDYWSLIIGTIVSNIFLAIWLTLKSDWVPRPRYDFGELRAMFTFSAWTLIEAFSIWLTTWAGALILGSLMSSYYLGLFNTSVSLVNAVTNVIAGAINPVAFSALSRLQFDKKRFNSTFYTMQSYLGFAVIPIACALFVFSDLLVGVFLGPSWTEASTFFGLYSLSSAFVVVFGHIASDAYRAIGKPQFSLAAQLGFLAFYVPSLYAGSVLGFAALSLIVPLARIAGSLVLHFLICRQFMGLSPLKMMKNMKWTYVFSFAVSFFAFCAIKFFGFGYLGQLIVAFFAAVLYLVLILTKKSERTVFFKMAGYFGVKGRKAEDEKR